MLRDIPSFSCERALISSMPSIIGHVMFLANQKVANRLTYWDLYIIDNKEYVLKNVIPGREYDYCDLKTKKWKYHTISSLLATGGFGTLACFHLLDNSENSSKIALILLSIFYFTSTLFSAWRWYAMNRERSALPRPAIELVANRV